MLELSLDRISGSQDSGFCTTDSRKLQTQVGRRSEPSIRHCMASGRPLEPCWSGIGTPTEHSDHSGAIRASSYLIYVFVQLIDIPTVLAV
jgi:hypothetical protein